MNVWSLGHAQATLFIIRKIMKNTISLNKNEQFLKVYRLGKRSYHKFFTLYYLPKGKEFNRLGFKVGKKLAKATRRNRVRRLLRESYRLLEDKISTGYDIILGAKDGCLELNSYEEVSEIVYSMMSRAKLIK